MMETLQMKPTTVQSVICSKERFPNVDQAKRWILSHNYIADKVDETEESYRFRQKEPSDFEEDSFRTIDLTDGVKAVIGKLKEKDLDRLYIMRQAMEKIKDRLEFQKKRNGKNGNGMTSTVTIQTLVLSKSRFDTRYQAQRWAREHEFDDRLVEETQDSWRIRQREPLDFEKGSFKLIHISEGVAAVIGELTGTKRTVGVRNNSLPSTYNISNVEIFASGEWNGDKYTEEDLDKVISAFNETKDQLKPYLKLGHSNKQGLVGKDELPAAGWIDSLKRVGNKIIADFIKVPRRIYELIKSGSYRRISSELYVDLKMGEKVYPLALKAVSILGGETPAVSNLRDIVELFGMDSDYQAVRAFDSTNKVKEYSLENSGGGKMQTIEELERELSQKERELAEMMPDEKKKEEEEDMKKQIAQLKEDNENLKKKLEALTKHNGELENYISKVKQEQKVAANTLWVEKQIDSGKLFPSQKEKVLGLLNNVAEEKKFKMGEKEDSFENHLKSFIESGMEVDINTEEESERGVKQSADMDTRTKQYIAQKAKEGKKVSYRDALLEIDKKISSNGNE